jgi:hypothetical protein
MFSFFLFISFAPWAYVFDVMTIHEAKRKSHIVTKRAMPHRSALLSKPK